MGKRQKRKRKRKTKAKKARNFLEISAWFRRSGPMRNKKKERAKKICREKPNEE